MIFDVILSIVMTDVCFAFYFFSIRSAFLTELYAMKADEQWDALQNRMFAELHKAIRKT